MTRTRVLGLACMCLVIVLQGGVGAASAPAAHVARSNPVPAARVAAPAAAAPTVAAPAAGSDPVTLTKHTDLGFNTSIPVSADTGVASPPCLLSFGVCLFHGAVAFSGTLHVAVKLGADLALSYDPADLNTSSGPLPVSIKYTATPGLSLIHI